ncbi:hypothetical protein P7C71_g738, partial [Lecanoromycetidae sp. Uapishka_2]
MAPANAKYSEIQHDEIEVLRSIYMEDFVEEEAKTGAWNKTSDHAFKIRLRRGANSRNVPTLDEERAVRARAARASADEAEEAKRQQALEQQAEEERNLQDLVKQHIWNFGVCFLQMAFGLAVTTQHESPFALLDGLKLTKSLQALLSQIFQIEPRKRPSAWDLLHFEFFRNDDTLLEEENSQEGMSRSDILPRTVESQRFHPRRESYTAPPSRYAKEFVEEGRLGRGGFGEVFRARNKTDGQPYAIKKIKASSRSALDPVLNSSESDMSSSMTNDRRRPVLPSSSRGLDFISSSNADVIFADNDDGEESSAEEEDEECSSKCDATDRSKPIELDGILSEKTTDIDPKTWTILYIQMEYCKQETLRDLINTGLQANAQECWRLFRQIVQGLAHIHGLSIVHRDLKPENIFIDSDGDVRIGDFGLARPGDYRTSATSTKPAREIFGSFTKDIGTASYVAPEVRSAGNGKYNEKADMFSLGVILLEMSVSFATGMERAQNLAKLQKEDHTLPAALDVPEKATQARIFSSLVQIKPSRRPSSAELLSGGDIPVQDEDESYRKARRLLADQSSHFRSGFISSLFPKSQTTGENQVIVENTSPDPMRAITLLEDVRAMSRSLPNDLELQATVRAHLTAIFHRHGALERTDSPALFPYHECYPSEDVVQFLSPTGKVMQLPYDLILPNAMSFAGRLRPERKTFLFDNVYRVDHLTDQPKIFGEANFDIVSEKSTNFALREAENLLDNTGVDILSELWSNNISAELAERNGEANGENLYTKTDDRADDHSWVVLVKAEDMAKVKNTSRKDETEVRVSELAAHLRTEIRDRDRQEARVPKASLLRHSSRQDSSVPDKDREVDIKVLTSQNKGKKVNRKTVVEEAQAHKRAYLQACADSPIVAIETKDEVFEGIIETRLSDPASWKEFIQRAAPGERQYLGDLQNMLKNMQKDVTPGHSNVIIYNFRTKACISYHLGKPS